MRLRSAIAMTVGVAAIAAASAIAGLGAMSFTYAWQVVRRAGRPERPSRIVAFDSDRITVERYREAERPGRFGLWFDDDRGYLRVGEVIERTARTVTRRVDQIDFGI